MTFLPLTLAIGAAGWALGRLWIYEQITAPLRDWLVPKLPTWRLLNLRYLFQCAYCFTAWAVAFVWVVTWIAMPVPAPALCLGTSLAIAWALVIYEVTSDAKVELFESDVARNVRDEAWSKKYEDER